MNKNIKTVIMLIGFVLMFGAAAFSYNILSKNTTQDNILFVSENDSKKIEEVNAENTGEVIEDNSKENTVENTKESESSADEDKKVIAPDFTVLDMEENEVKLSDMLGTPVIVNFWASWCPPCKSEMPDFDMVYKELGDDISFMMINQTDGMRETKKNADDYISEQGFSFPVYLDTELEATYTYGINAIPTTLFIDREGYIVAGVQGAINEATLRKGIELIQ